MAAAAAFGVAILTVSLVDRLPQVYWILVSLCAMVLARARPEVVAQRVPA